ncbi:MAG: N-6 DNA methylase [Deltaproteobacteria bacterium]|jgi:hypothetical protein|nr:N-6 DNA methylase [Deltaproteobacteria bacterium]
MLPLEKQQRVHLEKAIIEARQIAEDAARKVLENLCVSERDPSPHLNEKERKLRHRLRIHGKQLGDTQDSIRGVQEISLLIEEVAYEHWHRMLFAYFLAENNLLMYPDPEVPVPITLEECEELAPKEGAANGFELAARFATRMLPQIFRIDSPVFELTFPPEDSQKLEKILGELPKKVFTAFDSLGRIYQFWQTAKKNEINKSEIKIGPREIPAVTQLFTEPYIVKFLLDNSLGAWFAGKRLTEEDLKSAVNEEELRKKAALQEVPLEYLRFVRQKEGSFIPAGGTFTALPNNNICDLKIIDPCCGSGHFLITAFLMLVPMRMELEGLTAKKAVDAVLKDNIFGLDLDRRCVELASFAVTLTAWKYKNAGSYQQLPELNIACSGLSISLDKDEWLEFALGNSDLTVALKAVFETFKDAPMLGSLINPTASTNANLISWNKIKDDLKKELNREQKEERDERKEALLVAHELSKAANFLASKYHLVITNSHFLSSQKETKRLKKYFKDNYSEAYPNLATIFLERSIELCFQEGIINIVMPRNILFFKTFEKLRVQLLNKYNLHLIACLGFHAFESFMIWKDIMLISLSMKQIFNPKDNLHDETEEENIINLIHRIDVSQEKNPTLKAEHLREDDIRSFNQEKQLKNLESIIFMEESASTTLLNKFTKIVTGIPSSDNSYFGRYFWELPEISGDWVYWQNSSNTTIHFGGKNRALWVNDDFEFMFNHYFGRYQGTKAKNKRGLVITLMNKLFASIHTGEIHNTKCAIILPSDSENLSAIWCFCSSPSYREEVKKIIQLEKARPSTITKVPFDLDYWTKIAKEKYPHGLPEPYSNDPTQWIFHGHPCGSVIWDEKTKKISIGPLRIDDTVLQVAVARLLGYRWPAELDKNLHLAKEQREILQSCASLEAFTDKDGIVVIPVVRGEASAADRLLNLLAASYGNFWTNATLSSLLKRVDHADNSLDTWLREKFFIQHCKMFENIPFIWHIWDGQKNGFAALINYHKLDYKLLETLIYSYLGDWISRQKNDMNNNVAGAQKLLEAALALQKNLEQILIGEVPYDIFVRWKPLEKQTKGWNPDLNDGVRLNIRPFLIVPSVSKKDEGILRHRPNINWNKDRGKDLVSAPWYQTFKGDRINDHHLTLAEKTKES